MVGAHARGANTGTCAIAVIGNHQAAGTTRSGLDAAATVLAWQARVHGIDLRDGARATVSGRSLPTFFGHRDVLPRPASGGADGGDPTRSAPLRR